MKIYIIIATATHNEVDGTRTFVHRRAFAKEQAADEYLPIFQKEIADDKSGLLTYRKVNAKVVELDLE
jgi:hypothetical protein